MESLACLWAHATRCTRRTQNMHAQCLRRVCKTTASSNMRAALTEAETFGALRRGGERLPCSMLTRGVVGTHEYSRALGRTRRPRVLRFGARAHAQHTTPQTRNAVPGTLQLSQTSCQTTKTCGVSCLAAERKNVTRWWWVGLLGWVWRVLFAPNFSHRRIRISVSPQSIEGREPRERVGKRICFCVLLLWHLLLRETILVLTILGTCKRP
jgi:hypothetical protein